MESLQHARCYRQRVNEKALDEGNRTTGLYKNTSDEKRK